MRLVIVGASGRMGCALVHGSAELPASRVVAGIDRTDSPAVGRDFGELAGLAPLGLVVGSCLDDALSAVTTAQSCLDELDGNDGPLRRAQEQLVRALAALERLADEGN